MKIRTHSDKLDKLRRNVLELYVSDHPLDCETCPANGHCELQNMAEAHGVTDSRYSTARRYATGCTQRQQQSVLRFRSGPVHRVLALRARLRRNPGHVRADD